MGIFSRIGGTVCAAVLMFTPAGATAEQDELRPEPEIARGEILELGPEDARFFFVDHGGLVSIYADSVPADALLDALRPYGGPAYTSHEPLTRPVTLTLHRVPMGDVLRRMLVGYSFFYRYKGARIDHVRVLPMISGRGYKTPRAVESHSEWTRKELEFAGGRRSR